MIFNSIFEQLLSKSSSDSFIGKVYRKKHWNYFTNDFRKCELDKGARIDIDPRFNEIVLMMEEKSLLMTFSFLRSYFDDYIIFFKSETSFLESLCVYHYRKGFNFNYFLSFL